jgi:hypothetical protein
VSIVSAIALIIENETLASFGPIRNEPPSQHGEVAPLLGIEPHDGDLLGRRDVITRRHVVEAGRLREGEIVEAYNL